MPSIVYEYGENLYINLTNRCPCACEFCERQHADGIGSADSLWLGSEPAADEVLEEIRRIYGTKHREIVFCGYGEPFCALDTLLEVCRGLRTEYPGAVIRVNTNGLADLINNREVAPELAGLVDIISISLNTSDPAKYLGMCKPEFGDKSYPAVLRFAQSCKENRLKVILSVVDVIPEDDIAACREIADRLGVTLRVRPKY
ncbi:MAG: TatD family nuclease-associated radical SAM protein [Oscillospiraceae bacterium]|nr:TatD family nuclease-associated radical SAM protein [Oscillospiraceae bacterium]